jgi:SAM-dependent methyltransferase
MGLQLNSVPRLEYWNAVEWRVYIERLGLDDSYHRRYWEWVQVAYGLDRLGVLNGQARGLGIGVGNEPLIFYLATRAGEIVATDRYRNGWARSGQANPSMLRAPERFTTIKFPRERLRVMRMDALRLEFPDRSFDFLWSVGAIEHFGSSIPKHAYRLACRHLGLEKWATRYDHAGAVKSVKEMARVLKPGGIAALTTECILNGKPHHEFFLPWEIHRYIIDPSGMELVGGVMEVEPDPYFMDHILPKERWEDGELPHVILRDQNGVEFTSISLFLRRNMATIR